jgi:ubiquinone/menaquinone biosynthesis C-methylase UbiE
LSGLPVRALPGQTLRTVTKLDYEQIIIPAVEKALAKFHKMRFLYSLGDDFLEFETAAMWERRALDLAQIRDGQRILEVAVGTGVAFFEIAGRNPHGLDIAVYLSHG